MIQGILALYKIDPNGRMQRYYEIDMNMGRKYFPSSNGNMQLTRSKDKKIFSITNFDKHDKNGAFFKILAWSKTKTMNLKPFDTQDNFSAL
jgi:hypothetical protein